MGIIFFFTCDSTENTKEVREVYLDLGEKLGEEPVDPRTVDSFRISGKREIVSCRTVQSYSYKRNPFVLRFLAIFHGLLRITKQSS